MSDTRVTDKALPFAAHVLVGETTVDLVNKSINLITGVARTAQKEP